MMFKRKERGKSLKYWLISILLLTVIIPSLYLLPIRMEGEFPRIDLKLESRYIRAQADIPVRISDAKSGIRKFRAALILEGKEIVLKEMDYGEIEMPPRHIDFKLEISAKEMELADGAAVLRIEAIDNSWRKWFSGNRSQIEENLIIDATVPRITVLSRQHNVNRGGAGLVIYKLSEVCEKHGVFAGNEFFPGYAGYFEDPNLYLAFFALTHAQGPGTDLHVEAIDPAGNTGRSGFYSHIREKQFKSETMGISDAFLNRILPAFQQEIELKPGATAMEQFLYVNRELRKKNNATILGNGRQTDRKLHWDGAFLRLPNSAPKAAFADLRTYTYNNEIIDQAFHLGIDLASLQQAAVPAANNGRVAFTDYIGIYGLTVVIDHGFGLFSIYSHLSRTDLKAGAMVKKGDVIGYTGTTGLAGGDHLHYGIFIDHVFVNPVEWWDLSWIKNNITTKLEDAKMVTGSNLSTDAEENAGAQQ